MVNSNTFLRDVLYFIKNDLVSNISDPLSSRDSDSKFVMTSYPQRKVQYPLITIKATNTDIVRAGMQTNRMDAVISLEVRIWARNEKEKNDLYESVFTRLRQIQFTGSGSINADIHNFTQTSAIEIDEDGEGGIKSRVMEVTYNFYSFE